MCRLQGGADFCLSGVYLLSFRNGCLSALVAFLIGAAESLKTCLSEGYGIISCVCFGRHRVIVVILKE